ncbi:MAG: phage terminase large subunit, partial [Dehalococcoidia bacterium]|nr:phage terminase large subunit [Dehalococcoidia bacterium]
MLGGVGSGKTLVGALWALTMAIRFPGLVGLVGAQNPSQLSTVVLKAILPMLEKANIRFVYGMAPPGSWGEDRFTRHVNVLSLSNGTQVLCRSMTDAGVDRNIRGLELAWAWCDEARDMSEYAFEVLASRMRGFGDDAPYSIRLTSTPNGRDWLWRKFAPESPSRLVGAELFRARTKDNRHLPQGYEDRI